mmetsp:Transcript_28751/g.32873  ORF Transcript_28751/g.32873 Transcript_28751/m.32873 type:complete len:91 (+) Transcript_28751:1069-1341(+)
MQDFGAKYISQSSSPDYIIHIFRGFANHIGKAFNAAYTNHILSWKQEISTLFEGEELDWKLTLNDKDLLAQSVDLVAEPSNPFVVALESH